MTAAMLALVAALTRLDGRALAGAIGGALPDLEHLMPWVRQGGRAVFPTHSSARLHGSLPTRVELGGAAQLGNRGRSHGPARPGLRTPNGGARLGA
jgi:hypothetical protein